MELNHVMNQFDDMLIFVEDEKGNIVYPDNAQIIQYAKDLVVIGKRKDELRHPDTKRIYKRTRSSFSENNKIYYLTRYTEITEYKKREVELQTDETTGISIKKAIYQDFKDYLKTAIKTGEEFSTIIADADYFKRVNDTYGHQAGDCVLRHIADILKSNTRQSDNRPKDLIGRIGGEEYLIVLKNIPATVTLSRVNQIREIIANTPVVFEGQSISITCSFGIVHTSSKQIRLIPNRAKERESFRLLLQEEADLSLYKAKESGRNKVQLKRFTT